MAETQRDQNQGDAKGASRRGENAERNAKRTRGTNRDFDETNQSDNQGHGHPREERNQASED
jgi:hypothetical protein